MKILHISTYDQSGAGIAAMRLHKALLQGGMESKFLSLTKTRSDIPYHEVYSYSEMQPIYPSLSLKDYLKEKIFKTFTKYNEVIQKQKSERERYKTPLKNGAFRQFEYFSFAQNPYDLTQTPAYQWADIINLHWVADFLDYTTFFEKNKKPIVWTFHDANPTMGGFHLIEDEKNNQATHAEIDREIKNQKLNALKNKSLLVVTPSQWLKKFSEQSEAFQGKKHYQIFNGLDTSVFKPLDKHYARQTLNIPQNKKVILISAYTLESYNKGFDLFTDAIQNIKSDKDFYICALGGGKLADATIPIHYLGQIQDERLLSVVYNAVDCLVIPSRNENYPNVIIEALSCGTPVIGFPIGGVKEAIEHEKNGYLCPEISVKALQQTIEKFLDNSTIFDREKISQDAHKKYALEIQAKKYMELYYTLL